MSHRNFIRTFFLCAMLIAAPAFAATPFDIDFGFDMNTVSVEPLFTFDGASQTITADTAATADLTVDQDDVRVATFEDAKFELGAELVNVAPLSSSTMELTFAGGFAFTESVADGGDTIVTGNFDSAKMFLIGSQVGSTFTAFFASDLFTSSQSEGDFYDAEAALEDVLGPVTLQSPQDMFFTSTEFGSLNGTVTVVEDGQGGFTFEDFVFDSSYSGHVDAIPEPATLSVLGLAGLAVIRRRR